MRNLFFTIFIFLSFSICIFGQNKLIEQTNIENSKAEKTSILFSGTNFEKNKKPLKIIFKPKPPYPKSENGTICIQGTVTLRVEFLKSGKIGKVSAINTLPYEITELAIEAAKKIIFEPETINGESITVHKPVQFSFSNY